MRKEIQNYSRYYWQDGVVYNKKTGKPMILDNRKLYHLLKDNGKVGGLSIRKLNILLSPSYKTYQEIQQERGVKYHHLYNNPNYLFCEDVEDQLKVWSVKNTYFLTPYISNNHLRYSINSNRVMFYIIVWQYYNQTKLPKNWLVHHIDFNPNNNSFENLSAMTQSAHLKIHKIWKFKHHLTSIPS